MYALHTHTHTRTHTHVYLHLHVCVCVCACLCVIVGRVVQTWIHGLPCVDMELSKEVNHVACKDAGKAWGVCSGIHFHNILLLSILLFTANFHAIYFLEYLQLAKSMLQVQTFGKVNGIIDFSECLQLNRGCPLWASIMTKGISRAFLIYRPELCLRVIAAAGVCPWFCTETALGATEGGCFRCAFGICGEASTYTWTTLILTFTHLC